MRPFLTAAAATLLALTLGGCATMGVGSHVDRSADMTAFRTYAWGSADALPMGDPRLDDDPFFHDHMQGAVQRHIAARGLELAAPGTAPDLQLHYHAHVSRRLDVDRLDRASGYTSDSAPPVVEYEAGTIVLDVVDARTQKVIWRGWAQDRLKEMLESREAMAAQIEQAVTRMLERFPQVRAPRR